MAENTNIGWCHHTFSPWWGCTRVSPGCGGAKGVGGCYAEAFSHRLGKALWGPTAERQMASESYWKQPHAWNKKAHDADDRHRVFCSSMCDIFEDRPELRAPRARLFRLIEECIYLDFLLLTKRPENMVWMAKEAGWTHPWPPHVWAGCTVENQALADKRVPELLRVPARVRFLSMEPLLEAVDVSFGLGMTLDEHGNWRAGNGLSWLIVGGESGPGSRPFNIAWARSIHKECRAKNIPFFCKQLGSKPVVTEGSADARKWGADGATGICDDLGNLHLKHKKGEDFNEWPFDLRVQEFPS